MTDLADLIANGSTIEIEEIDGLEWSGSTVPVGFESIKRQTDRAVLFVVNGDEVWIPKSVIAAIEGDCADVAEWWARREGFA
jgi:hypothetical protein